MTRGRTSSAAAVRQCAVPTCRPKARCVRARADAWSRGVRWRVRVPDVPSCMVLHAATCRLWRRQRVRGVRRARGTVERAHVLSTAIAAVGTRGVCVCSPVLTRVFWRLWRWMFARLAAPQVRRRDVHRQRRRGRRLR